MPKSLYHGPDVDGIYNQLLLTQIPTLVLGCPCFDEFEGSACCRAESAGIEDYWL